MPGGGPDDISNALEFLLRGAAHELPPSNILETRHFPIALEILFLISSSGWHLTGKLNRRTFLIPTSIRESRIHNPQANGCF